MFKLHTIVMLIHYFIFHRRGGNLSRRQEGRGSSSWGHSPPWEAWKEDSLQSEDGEAPQSNEGNLGSHINAVWFSGIMNYHKGNKESHIFFKTYIPLPPGRFGNIFKSKLV